MPHARSASARRVGGTVGYALVLTVIVLVHSALAEPEIFDLSADLTCTEHRCVNLGRGDVLRLNGFTVNVMPGGIGISCGSTCTIIGPGTIRGGNYGAFGWKYKVENVTFTEHAYVAMEAVLVKATGITIVNNNDGIIIGHATGPDPPSAGSRVIVRDSVISDNLGTGVSGYKRAVVYDSVISGNGAQGVTAVVGGVKLIRAQILDNGTDGVRAPAGIRAIDSSVTGSGTDPACGVDVNCADLASGAAPRLRDSTCDTSRNLEAGGTWGVCALD